ncbi:glutamate-1-semialdehyde 2,1-aminomutase [Methanobacterium alcaliphilum]|uniref:glutamate-1-semialdehyde 2,1-aminomutase n=1 Tax=Methanobacterium alcaliphilum TaxID=392018 RepID=UPI00200A421A|nr:glutamate-1-semialdehyde 2,1-aminomutase [Methanobacterium alcaliphilum]MCK9152384.1 glutamate-1-semialdehyde 2,1-aminomutase [Methanobacterium alcaliphilum]
MRSEDLFKESQNFLPGGVDSPVRAFKPYPFFAQKGKGSKLEDVDGNNYIDYCLGYGPLILGHAPKKVIADVTSQIHSGTTYGVPTEKEIELAKLVVKKVPCAEMVRFVNSGTEATMAAIRLARGFTEKNKIVKFEGSYHGAHDYVLVKSGSGAACLPDSLGVPTETTKNTLSTPFNDEEAVVNLIENEGSDIAAIIMEPVMGNVGCIEPEENYLNFLRKITTENDILLIFDEVITGFRLAEGGAQEYFGVTPDLITMGKIIGGGFPMGSFAGKKEIMEMIAPSGGVYQAGTFNGNPVSVTAGLSTLNQLDKKFYSKLNQKGQTLRDGIQNILDDNQFNLNLAGLCSMFQIYFNDQTVKSYSDAKKSDVDKFSVYFHELLKSGVFIAPSQFECGFLSQAHSGEDLEKTIELIGDALKKSME